ncbi:MAG: hypothetical protein M3527_01050 [Actinomycetota bacterium]|nr:hypothetical protein [Actinomycetota bacterium]
MGQRVATQSNGHSTALGVEELLLDAPQRLLDSGPRHRVEQRVHDPDALERPRDADPPSVLAGLGVVVGAVGVGPLDPVGEHLLEDRPVQGGRPIGEQLVVALERGTSPRVRVVLRDARRVPGRDVAIGEPLGGVGQVTERPGRADVVPGHPGRHPAGMDDVHRQRLGPDVGVRVACVDRRREPGPGLGLVQVGQAVEELAVGQRGRIGVEHFGEGVVQRSGGGRPDPLVHARHASEQTFDSPAKTAQICRMWRVSDERAGAVQLAGTERSE